MISKGFFALTAAALVVTGSPVHAEPSSVFVEYLEITGLIDPPTSAYLLREIRNANKSPAGAGVGAMVIRLDSTGGVEASLDELVNAFSTSRVPIVVWVAPGARAEAAAGFLLEAAPIKSTAASLPEVLESLREHPDLRGRTFIPRFHKMTSLERLQHGAIRPWAAYMLLLLGVFLIIFEVYNPGVGGAAVAGGAALYFAFYGLSVLPVRWFGVGLVILGLGLFTYDLRELRLGRASVVALLAFGAGSFFAFPRVPDEVALGLPAIAAGLAATLLFFIPVMTQALKARTARPIAGADKVLGTTGIARTDIAPDGQVSAGGTLWRARTLGAAIGEGSPVEIKGVSGLVLMVEEVQT